MHIYHYAAYEPAAMLRLALRHGIHEYEVDSLIRDGVFVDLYTIVRRAFRFSTESMSIKYIEAIYQDKRDKTQGTSSLISSSQTLCRRPHFHRRRSHRVISVKRETDQGLPGNPIF
jgi:predicted RecB family nuclease